MSSIPPYFGVVIPGRPVITDFQAIDNTKAITMIQQPSTVPEITMFLLPTAPIPNGFGAILYYSLPPFQAWEIIGCVTIDKPSGSFRTNWTTNEEVLRSNIVQLEDRFAFAHKIAMDLFQYMSSFSQSSQP
eukprot:gene21196-27458_t